MGWIGSYMVEVVLEKGKLPYISDKVEEGKRVRWKHDRYRWNRCMRKALSTEETHAW